jgi:soluble lytic murein transglycosylase-like protein
VNVNGVFLPQRFGSYPYPTAYGYAAGPAHAVHLPQVRALPGAFSPFVAAQVAPVPTVAAVKSAPVEAVAVKSAPVEVVAVKSAPVKVVTVEAAPVAAVAVAPVAAVKTVAPVAAVKAGAAVPAVTSSQYHAQDEAGNYKYGYNNINSAAEAAGNVHEHYEAGYYSTQDRTVQYVADSNGFREV